MSIFRTFLWIGVVLVAAACSKSTLVGSELLENERADVQYVDSLDLRFTTVVDDSVQTFPASLDRRRENYLLGQISDPVFGTSASEIYMHIGLGFSSNPLNLLSGEIDSVVLYMEYDTNGLYGEQGVPVSIEVRQMLESMDIDENYFANQSFEVDQAGPLGVLEHFVPQPFDSVLVTTPDDTTLQLPHLRIPLDPGFLDAILTDTVNLQNQDSLNAVFNGLNIRMSQPANTMLSFNLKGYSGVTVFYRIDGERTAQYDFEFGFTTVTTMHQEHNYTGSFVEPFIENQELGDSLFFVQSMIGLNAHMNIDHASSLGNVLINHATIEMYGVQLDFDDGELYPPIDQMVTLDVNDDGEVVYSTDVVLPLSADLLVEIFGGNAGAPLAENPRIRKYEMTVTSQVQDIFKGKNDRIVFASFLKTNRANRVVFLGPSNREYPPRLKLAYTIAP